MKIKRFQAVLQKKNIDFALIYNAKNTDINFFYFTEQQIDYSFLIIPKKGNSTLITSKLEFERAKKYSKINKVLIINKPIFEFINEIIGKKTKTLGINKSIVTLNEFKGIKKQFKNTKFVDIGSDLLELRSIKTPDEVKLIKKACQITDQIFKKLIIDLTTNTNFKTEQDIINFLKNEAQSKNFSLSFDPIVASGKNGSMPHYKGGNQKLQKGFLVLDFGINYKGYFSDMTRTIYLGKPSKSEIDTYNKLLNVQKKIIKQIKTNEKASKLMFDTQKMLGNLEKNFIHGLGHGIGVEIHELPNLSTLSKNIIKPGQVFTIEPGIYIPNKFGIRIEDDILMNKDKVQILTKSNKDLIIIKKS